MPRVGAGVFEIAFRGERRRELFATLHHDLKMMFPLRIVPLAAVVLLLSASCRNPEAKRVRMDSLARKLAAKRVLLPNGWSLSAAGSSLPLGDFPLNLVVSRSGKYIAVTNNGQGKQSLQLIAPGSGKILDEVEIRASWLGLVFSRDESKLYASGGNDNQVVVYAIHEGKLIKNDSIVLGRPWPVKISPTGIALNDDAGKLFIATKEDSALYIADLASKKNDPVSNGTRGLHVCTQPRQEAGVRLPVGRRQGGGGRRRNRGDAVDDGGR